MFLAGVYYGQLQWMPDKSTSHRDRLGMTEYCGQVSHIKSGSLLFDEPLALSRNLKKWPQKRNDTEKAKNLTRNPSFSRTIRFVALSNLLHYSPF